MDILHLRYFCDAAESESLSRAARKNGVPVSNISRIMKHLEEELQSPLFIRTSNTLRLSEGGKIFYAAAQKALDALDTATAKLRDEGDAPQGSLALCVSANRRIVTEAIEAFKAQHPQVSFVIHHRMTEGERYDVIVSAEEGEKKGYVRSPLITERIALAVSASSPLANKKSVAVATLEGEKFISMQDGSSLQRIALSICKRSGFSPDITIKTDDPHYVRKYLELGLGVALVPTLSWRGLFSDKLCLIDIGDEYRTTYLYEEKASPSRARSLFVAALREVFRKEEAEK